MTRTCAFVFARGGSKGLPNKNLLPIGNLPLIVHSIQLAQSIKEVDSIYVSTDSQRIADVAADAGAQVIFRPGYLATDASPEWLSWQHAIHEVQSNKQPFDIFLSLPATSPLRSKNDVYQCLDALKPDIDIVLTMSSARRSPWFNMVTLNDSGLVDLVSGDSRITRRQDCPDCYDLTTVAYVARSQFILNATSIWDGNATGVIIPPERAIDIDTRLDYLTAKFIYEQVLPR